MVASVRYKYFNDDVDDYLENNPKVLNNLWTHTDSQAHGRCFSLVPTIDHIKLGVQEIRIALISSVYAFIHTPENFISAKPNTDRLQELFVSLGYSYLLDVKHDLFKMLDDGKSCMSDPKYSRDQCAREEVERISLEKFGCTNPYGYNKTKICQDPIISSKVIEIYTNKIEKRHNKCLNPCSFFSIMAIKMSATEIPTFFGKARSQIKINFKENIKVTTGYYLYSGLSLFAEIGGYIGLGQIIVWAFEKLLNFGENLKLI